MSELDNALTQLTQAFDSITFGLMHESMEDLGVLMTLAQNLHNDEAADVLGKATRLGVNSNMVAHLLTLAYGIGKGVISPLRSKPQMAILTTKGVETIN